MSLWDAPPRKVEPRKPVSKKLMREFRRIAKEALERRPSVFKR